MNHSYTVGDLLANPELLEQEAQKVAEMIEEDKKKEREPWDQGPDAISNPEQFAAILNNIGQSSPEDYEHFCKTGKDF